MHYTVAQYTCLLYAYVFLVDFDVGSHGPGARLFFFLSRHTPHFTEANYSQIARRLLLPVPFFAGLRTPRFRSRDLNFVHGVADGAESVVLVPCRILRVSNIHCNVFAFSHAIGKTRRRLLRRSRRSDAIINCT